jgi:hypothetical protein
MKKLLQLWRKEEIPQTTGWVFLLMAIASFAAVLLAPLQMTKEQAVLIYANDPNGIGQWVFALSIPTALALVVGVCMTLWRLKWPSKEEVL